MELWDGVDTADTAGNPLLEVTGRRHRASEEYGGWSNMDTWRVVMVMDNDPFLYSQTAGNTDPGFLEAAWNSFDEYGESGVDSSKVNWQEIADSRGEGRTAARRHAAAGDVWHYRVTLSRGNSDTVESDGGFSSWEDAAAAARRVADSHWFGDGAQVILSKVDGLGNSTDFAYDTHTRALVELKYAARRRTARDLGWVIEGDSGIRFDGFATEDVAEQKANTLRRDYPGTKWTVRKEGARRKVAGDLSPDELFYQRADGSTTEAVFPEGQGPMRGTGVGEIDYYPTDGGRYEWRTWVPAANGVAYSREQAQQAIWDTVAAYASGTEGGPGQLPFGEPNPYYTPGENGFDPWEALGLNSTAKRRRTGYISSESPDPNWPTDEVEVKVISVGRSGSGGLVADGRLLEDGRRVWVALDRPTHMMLQGLPDPVGAIITVPRWQVVKAFALGDDSTQEKAWNSWLHKDSARRRHAEVYSGPMVKIVPDDPYDNGVRVIVRTRANVSAEDFVVYYSSLSTGNPLLSEVERALLDRGWRVDSRTWHKGGGSEWWANVEQVLPGITGKRGRGKMARRIHAMPEIREVEVYTAEELQQVNPRGFEKAFQDWDIWMWETGVASEWVVDEFANVLSERAPSLASAASEMNYDLAYVQGAGVSFPHGFRVTPQMARDLGVTPPAEAVQNGVDLVVHNQGMYVHEYMMSLDPDENADWGSAENFDAYADEVLDVLRDLCVEMREAGRAATDFTADDFIQDAEAEGKMFYEDGRRA